MQLNRNKMKQYGFIMPGNGINLRYWIDEAKKQGYAVLILASHVELWK
jgi:hypothetical protein